MRRSKAAVSVEVKRVIGALCRLLAGLGLDPVPAPEAFRRAKFGGEPEEEPFCLLLSNILQRSEVIPPETSRRLRGDYRTLVAVGLWQSGFHGDWTRGGCGSASSRDLLLALGWLLADGVLETLLAGRVAELDRTSLSAAPPLVTTVTPGVHVPEKPDAASLRRLQWLMGNLRHQGRTLLSAVGARSRALQEVLSVSQAVPAAPPAGRHPAAPPAGRHPAALTEDCECLQQLCDLLEAYVSWKQVEDVFWTWMDSVADRRPPGQNLRTSERSPGTCYHGNQSPGTCCHGNQSPGTCCQGNQRLDEESWSRHGGRSSEEDGGVASLAPGPASCVRRVWRPRLQTDRRPAGGALAACQAAELLLQAEAELLQRRDGRRSATRGQLERLMDGLEDKVFIPL